nr:hypothetical protein [Candidatus Neomarinimicrobiota bacterium]
MKRLIVLISVTFLILGFTGTAGALPMNFGFETGDFSYWNKSISGDWAKVVTSHSDYGPKAGNYFAKLKAVGTEGTQIYQNFSIGADETISGWAAFNWGDYPDYWDSAWVKIYEGTDLSANPLYTAWNESGANPYNNDPDPNDHYPEYYNVPWAQWSWKAPSTVTGTYTIAYGVANTVDGAW